MSVRRSQRVQLYFDTGACKKVENKPQKKYPTILGAQHYHLEDPTYGELYQTVMNYDNGTQIKGDYCKSPEMATKSCVARCNKYEHNYEGE
jgi:hypothetical protein